jgi:ELL-associated factor
MHSITSQNLNFSGRVKNANPKECILIIDRETGEITIETLSSQILVKKTRPERNPDPPAQGNLTPTSASSTPAASFNSTPSTNSSRSQMPIERAKPSQAKPSLPKPPQPKGIRWPFVFLVSAN